MSRSESSTVERVPAPSSVVGERHEIGYARGRCGRSSMVERQLPKLDTRVRFSSPAPRPRLARNCAHAAVPRNTIRLMGHSRPDGAASSTGWLAYLPGLSVPRTYRRAWLSKDLVAGLVLSALLVPQGMAYAQLASLPPVTGLYTSILCLIGYAVFGPSRVLVLGPDSA